jgi:hypothetical protein
MREKMEHNQLVHEFQKWQNLHSRDVFKSQFWMTMAQLGPVVSMSGPDTTATSQEHISDTDLTRTQEEDGECARQARRVTYADLPAIRSEEREQFDFDITPSEDYNITPSEDYDITTQKEPTIDAHSSFDSDSLYHKIYPYVQIEAAPISFKFSSDDFYEPVQDIDPKKLKKRRRKSLAGTQWHNRFSPSSPAQKSEPEPQLKIELRGFRFPQIKRQTPKHVTNKEAANEPVSRVVNEKSTLATSESLTHLQGIEVTPRSLASSVTSLVQADSIHTSDSWSLLQEAFFHLHGKYLVAADETDHMIQDEFQEESSISPREDFHKDTPDIKSTPGQWGAGGTQRSIIGGQVEARRSLSDSFAIPQIHEEQTLTSGSFLELSGENYTLSPEQQSVCEELKRYFSQTETDIQIHDRFQDISGISHGKGYQKGTSDTNIASGPTDAPDRARGTQASGLKVKAGEGRSLSDSFDIPQIHEPQTLASPSFLERSGEDYTLSPEQQFVCEELKRYFSQTEIDGQTQDQIQDISDISHGKGYQKGTSDTNIAPGPTDAPDRARGTRASGLKVKAGEGRSLSNSFDIPQIHEPQSLASPNFLERSGEDYTLSPEQQSVCEELKRYFSQTEIDGQTQGQIQDISDISHDEGYQKTIANTKIAPGQDAPDSTRVTQASGFGLQSRAGSALSDSFAIAQILDAQTLAFQSYLEHFGESHILSSEHQSNRLKAFTGFISETETDRQIQDKFQDKSGILLREGYQKGTPDTKIAPGQPGASDRARGTQASGLKVQGEAQKSLRYSFEKSKTQGVPRHSSLRYSQHLGKTDPGTFHVQGSYQDPSLKIQGFSQFRGVSLPTYENYPRGMPSIGANDVVTADGVRRQRGSLRPRSGSCASRSRSQLRKTSKVSDPRLKIQVIPLSRPQGSPCPENVHIISSILRYGENDVVTIRVPGSQDVQFLGPRGFLQPGNVHGMKGVYGTSSIMRFGDSDVLTIGVPGSPGAHRRFSQSRHVDAREGECGTSNIMRFGDSDILTIGIPVDPPGTSDIFVPVAGPENLLPANVDSVSSTELMKNLPSSISGATDPATPGVATTMFVGGFVSINQKGPQPTVAGVPVFLKICDSDASKIQPSEKTKKTVKFGSKSIKEIGSATDTGPKFTTSGPSAIPTMKASKLMETDDRTMKTSETDRPENQQLTQSESPNPEQILVGDALFLPVGEPERVLSDSTSGSPHMRIPGYFVRFIPGTGMFRTLGYLLRGAEVPSGEGQPLAASSKLTEPLQTSKAAGVDSPLLESATGITDSEEEREGKKGLLQNKPLQIFCLHVQKLQFSNTCVFSCKRQQVVRFIRK